MVSVVRVIHSLQTADSLFCENENPCVNGGVCTYLGNSQYTCECPLGYNGTNCELSESRRKQAESMHAVDIWVVVKRTHTAVALWGPYDLAMNATLVMYMYHL